MINYHLNIKTNKNLSSELRKVGNTLKYSTQGQRYQKPKSCYRHLGHPFMAWALLCLANIMYIGNLLILCIIYVCKCCVYKQKSMCACVGLFVCIYIHYIAVLNTYTFICINELANIFRHLLSYIYIQLPCTLL